MAEVDTRHSMIRKSDQNYSALIGNPNTDNFVQVTQWFENLIRTAQHWSEKNTQNWSALISNYDAAQRWSEHVGGGKYWASIMHGWCIVIVCGRGIAICGDPSCPWVCGGSHLRVGAPLVPGCCWLWACGGSHQYFTVPHLFLQESSDSSGIPLE